MPYVTKSYFQKVTDVKIIDRYLTLQHEDIDVTNTLIHQHKIGSDFMPSMALAHSLPTHTHTYTDMAAF